MDGFHTLGTGMDVGVAEKGIWEASKKDGFDTLGTRRDVESS
jgi:hypothetical protein